MESETVLNILSIVIGFALIFFRKSIAAKQLKRAECKSDFFSKKLQTFSLSHLSRIEALVGLLFVANGALGFV